MIDIINDLNTNKRIVLNPQLRMRKDIDRIYIFTVNPFTYKQKNKRIYLQPAEAIVLALFDGKKEFRTVVNDLITILGIKKDTAQRIIRNIIKRYKEYLVVNARLEEEIIKYDPCDFIIQKKHVDIQTLFPKIPEIIMFIPTFKCNYKCRYCYAPRHQHNRMLSLDKINGMLTQMNEWHIPSIFFSGGDPLCHPHINDILQLCVDYGIKPMLPTKSIITNKQIDFLLQMKINEIQISIDIDEDMLCRMLLGTNSNYISSQLYQIEYLIKQGIQVYTNSVLTSYTIRHVPALVQRLHSLGVQRMSFSQYSRSRYCHQDDLFCDPNDYEWLDREIKILHDTYPALNISYKNMKDPTFMSLQEKEMYFQNRPNCTAGKMGMVVLPDGQITICETLYYNQSLIIGDLRTSSIKEVWNAERRQVIVLQSPKYLSAGVCTSCPEIEYCYVVKGKCYVRALQAYNDPKMPDPYCPKSVKGLRIL